jgi:hypothetical protein
VLAPAARRYGVPALSVNHGERRIAFVEAVNPHGSFVIGDFTLGRWGRAPAGSRGRPAASIT